MINAMQTTAAVVPFAPTDIVGSVAWYDFSDVASLWKDTGRTSAVTADADVIKGVTDKSGAGHHLSEATNGPAYKTAIQNSKSVARFTAASSQKLTSGSYAWSTDWTIFVVASRTSTTGTQQLFDGDGTQRNFQTRYVAGAATARSVVFPGVSFADQTVSVAGTVDVICFRSQASTTGGEQTFVNGTGGTAVDTGTQTTTARVQTLGCTNGDGAASAFLNGDICEAIAYNTALSAGNRNTVEAYLKTKWGTP